MKIPFLPSFLYGDDSFEVSPRLKPSIRRIAWDNATVLSALNPAPSPESQRSSTPVVMTARDFGPGFHLLALLPSLYDALIEVAVEMGSEEGYEQMTLRQTELYAEVLAQPWGVLCALPIDAQPWVFDGDGVEDRLSPERVRLLLQAVIRERDWLRSMDGRYEYRGEKPGHLWQAQTIVNWLAARHKLPVPTSQATWDSTVQCLLELTPV
ncbi:hypothetical protein [Deinococcus aquatilis]|uniref:hypothetical protein n=1 Tax=Deinococcus aquatilis TaxID=519440 RepID=UPI0003739E11|nr:hypothetical protein [Deinococcus aquatilis]